MADMKLKYTIQPYQTEAVESVVDVFAGQPYRACGAYRRDLPVQKGLEHYTLLDEADALGYANAVLTLDQTQLLTNHNRVQARQNLHQSSALTTALGALSQHVKIVPMGDDESGTCIVETPEEIIDASVSTQMSNIRDILRDQMSAL